MHKVCEFYETDWHLTCVCMYLCDVLFIFLERYKQIPILMFRLQFLELQTDLLLEFSHDLSQAIKRCGSTPFTNEYIAYLNASTYIASVLKQWGEETVSDSSLCHII